eukprot:TRINITY_DN67687_c9_g1_i1.p1 TRINITY_DN67687_c9_g1~~TRINITY_DN67687_c9_g1_i1.p1  ORF type:complete len:698 (+),score=107.68 TRINITY_DN67687_c9_g1_i1:47-2140(+)
MQVRKDNEKLKKFVPLSVPTTLTQPQTQPHPKRCRREPNLTTTTTTATADPSESLLRLFLIDTLFTPEECKELISNIEEAEKQINSEDQAGGEKMEDVKKWYNPDLRKHSRMLVKNQQLASTLFSRIVSFFSSKELFGVAPSGEQVHKQDVWLPVGLNEVFRIAKYQQGDYFKKHLDVPWRQPTTQETNNAPSSSSSSSPPSAPPSTGVADTSIFTLLVYLNEDFDGGETVWYKQEPSSPADASGSTPDDSSFSAVFTYKPAAGTGCVFNHNTWHEGKPIRSGTKYLIRTDVMFRLVYSGISSNDGIPLSLKRAMQTSPEATEVSRMFQEALEGRVKHGLAIEQNKYSEDSPESKQAIADFTSKFIEASAKQAMLGTSNTLPHTEKKTTTGLIISIPEVLILALSYLDWRTLLSCRLASSYLCRAATDGTLWRPAYTSVWGEGSLNRQYADKVDNFGPSACSVWWFGEFIRTRKRVHSHKQDPKEIAAADVGDIGWYLWDYEQPWWIIIHEPWGGHNPGYWQCCPALMPAYHEGFTAEAALPPDDRDLNSAAFDALWNESLEWEWKSKKEQPRKGFEVDVEIRDVTLDGFIEAIGLSRGSQGVFDDSVLLPQCATSMVKEALQKQQEDSCTSIRIEASILLVSRPSAEHVTPEQTLHLDSADVWKGVTEVRIVDTKANKTTNKIVISPIRVVDPNLL